MKRIAVAVAVLLVLACSSTKTPAGPKANVPEPVFNVDQLVGPADQNYPDGDFEVKLRLGIRNNASVPLTLQRVTVRTANPAGGAYTLYPKAYYFKKTINPNAEMTVDFWARGFCYGRSSREAEPVTITGTAYFTTPSGSYDLPFMRELSQYR